VLSASVARAEPTASLPAAPEPVPPLAPAPPPATRLVEPEMASPRYERPAHLETARAFERSTPTPAFEPAANVRRAVPPMRDEGAVPVAEPAPSESSDWLLDVNGVTHAPVDLGVNGELELPVGLRVSGGYGWVPSAYLNVISQVATLGMDTSTGAGAIAQRGWQNGNTWRIAGGIRPFKNTGVYLDAGYCEVRLHGAFDPSAFGVPASDAGRYAVETTVRMWLVELGYETAIAHRIVFGVGVGVMGTLSAKTSVSGAGSSAAQLSSATDVLDRRVEQYGYVPTLSARLGFNLI
jgi:hypothetical protein